MVINYQDNNLIVTYLQVYLAERSGLTVHRVVPRSKRKPAYYEVTQNDPIIVTGYYNPQTYTALALYMAYNYPNEGYPFKWYKDSLGNWIKEDYVYNGNYDELVEIISNNLEAFPTNREVIQVPERVLSYIFEEVVTETSSPEEILRIKQLMYDFIYADAKHPHPLTYTDELTIDVMTIQQSIVDKYTLEYGNKVSIITMTYEKDPDGEYILDSDAFKIPILTYNIGGQLSRVVATTTDTWLGGEGGKLKPPYVSRLDNYSLKIELSTSLISEVVYYYEEGGQSVSQVTTNLEYKDNYWIAKFKDPIGLISEDGQLDLTYQMEFTYDIITGDITFNDFEENRKILVNEFYNKVVNFPENLQGFKITGYVDPWTEVIIKKGFEEKDG